MKIVPRETTLRGFGNTFGVVFGLIALLLWYKGSLNGAFCFAMGGLCFVVCGLSFPMLLDIPERAWMYFGEKISLVSTKLLLLLLFLLVVTPTAILVRAFRKNLLSLAYDANRSSYWEDVRPDGPSSRPDKPF